MTDAVFHSTTLVSGAALRFREFAARLGRSLERATIAHGARRTLDELPDNLLRDLGLTRSDIPFVAGSMVSKDNDRGTAPHRLPHIVIVRANGSDRSKPPHLTPP